MNPSPPPSRSRLPLVITIVVLLSAAGYFGWSYLQRPREAPPDAQPALVPSAPPLALPLLADAPVALLAIGPRCGHGGQPAAFAGALEPLAGRPHTDARFHANKASTAA